MRLTTTHNQLYIVELRSPFERLEIQFVPKQISHSRQPRIGDIEIVNRNAPRFHHSGGKDTVQLTLEFYADDDDRKDVLNKVNWLQSLTFDDRQIKLVWGDMYKDLVFIVGPLNVVTSGFNSFHNMRPQMAKVDLTLFVDDETNRTVEDVRVQI